ncbi:MAG: zinc-ribbon domain-containing protein, partial [Polyangiaceae bacterium]
MYVKCERCQTEYEFDDALVSERGTTVKCTNCGHQFKVRREAKAGGAAGEDRWVVTTAAGKDLVFTSLKELQRAILAKLVGRADTLARGDTPPRPLHSIAELTPFFDEKRRAASNPPEGEIPAARKPMRTLSSRPPPPPGAANPGLAPPKRNMRSDPPPVRPRIETLRPPDGTGAAVPPPPLVARVTTGESAVAALAQTVAASPSMAQSVASPEPARSRAPSMPDEIPVSGSTKIGLAPGLPPQVRPAPIEVPAEPTAPLYGGRIRPPLPNRANGERAREEDLIEVTSPLPPPTRPYRRSLPSDYDESEALRVPGASQPPSFAGSSRRVGGWVVAAVLLLGAGALAAVVGKPYLEHLSKPASALAPLDPRAQGFLTAGENALAAGDLDLAKENFDKASVLVEKDPRVLLAVARLAAARADVPWLKQRLLPEDAEEMRSNRQLLEDLGTRAKKAADEAIAVSPEDPVGIRAKVDALRIAGDRDAARALVGRVAVNASQPETAYVLGALDLAELDPPWPVVIERLRAAAAGEGTAGRARAALVYALARSGDVSGAKTELDRLIFQAKPHTLVPYLRSFVDRTKAAKADGGAPLQTVDVNKLPVQNMGSASSGGGGGGGASGGGAAAAAGANIPSDPRVILQMAESAKARNELPRARALYEAAVAKNA